MSRRLHEREIVEEDEFGEAIPAARNDVWVERDTDTVVRDDSRSTAASIVSWLATALSSLLIARMVLRLIGASPSNGIVAAVYDLSRPFVAPFIGATGVEINTGVGSFETATLIALIVYGLIAYLIVKAIRSLTRNRY